MSPVTIEAVYERVPTAPERRAPARVRLGFRARFSAGADGKAAAADGPAPPPGGEGAAGRASPPREAAAPARHPGRGPRRGPREILPDPSPLAYSREGGLLPLPPAGGGIHGCRLDLLA